MRSSLTVALFAVLFVVVSGAHSDRTTPNTVDVSLADYTELYRKAHLKEAELRYAADLAEEKTKRTAQQHAHEKALEAMRLKYSRHFVDQAGGKKPFWLTASEGGIDVMSNAGARNWVVLETNATASWDHAAGASHAVLNFDVYIRVFGDGWAVIPYVLICLSFSMLHLALLRL